MNKSEKKEAVREWSAVLRDHPRFAQAFLAQQAILIEAAERGDRLIEERMCELLERRGFLVMFSGYWQKHCKKAVRLVDRIDPRGINDCLTSGKDPKDCFSIKHEDEWFDDPFAGGRTHVS
jgi:hypothetical protein